MKDLIKIIIAVCLVALVYIYRNNISNFISDNIIYKGSNQVLTYNEYYLDYDYLYVQNIDKDTVDNYQDILNMFYSILNSGDDSFSFFCNYTECINDAKKLISSDEVIANINNFVHPYNSFESINIDIANSGKITVTVKKVYDDEKINYIDNYINEFMLNNINDEMNTMDKIKVFHDNIINNTIYDEDSSKESYDAYELLTTGKSICGGYSDIMSIYLNKLEIQNYKITSEDHIWNLVYLDNNWYHLDTTWDDPVASDGNQYLIHNFFMISTQELLALDNVEHNYDINIYLEAN